MATKKFEELQGYSDQDLAEELTELEALYQRDSMVHAVRGLDNPISIRVLRKDIARLKTEMRKRELSKMSEEELANRSKIRARRRK